MTVRKRVLGITARVACVLGLAVGATLMATAAYASSGGGWGATADVFWGPVILADGQSFVGENGSYVESVAYWNFTYNTSGWSGCTVHVALRDDSIPTTVHSGTYSCYLGGSDYYPLSNYPVVSGHHYHVYSWVTGYYNGTWEDWSPANSPEMYF